MNWFWRAFYKIFPDPIRFETKEQCWERYSVRNISREEFDKFWNETLEAMKR